MPVGDESQVGEGLLRGSDLALGAREEVGKVDEEAAVALPLVRRQRQDARHVEVLARVLLLAEVADEVAPFCVCNGHDVEEEGLHVEVERLVVQEELGQQAQVLAVLLVPGNTLDIWEEILTKHLTSNLI